MQDIVHRIMAPPVPGLFALGVAFAALARIHPTLSIAIAVPLALAAACMYLRHGLAGLRGCRRRALQVPPVRWMWKLSLWVGYFGLLALVLVAVTVWAVIRSLPALLDLDPVDVGDVGKAGEEDFWDGWGEKKSAPIVPQVSIECWDKQSGCWRDADGGFLYEPLRNDLIFRE